MKSLVFDSGPIISLSMNSLLWVLPELKKIFKGKFYITQSVKKETIDNPINSKRFKFEALQVFKEYKENILEMFEKPDLKQRTEQILDISNNLFSGYGKNINIVQYAEMEVLAAAFISRADAVVIDERTTRLLVENPEKLRNILQKKLHTPISVNTSNLIKLKNFTKNIKVIRSTELILIAYEKGLLNKYILDISSSRKTLVDGLLWGLKLNGCSISGDEISKIISIEEC